MNKEIIYEWRDSLAACFCGSLGQCNNWGNQCVKEGWVRVDNTLTHPNHSQILKLVELKTNSADLK